MATEMDFCLLGPLTVRSDGMLITVPPGKQRVILATLLLSADRVVHLDELAETLWISGPPPSGLVAVQNYVMRLRKALGDAGRDRIITQPRGYLIHVDAGELDVSRFEALLGAARAAARDSSWDQAAMRARGALELWRGEPLADVDSEVLAEREIPRLAEMRLQAAEARIGADLHLGRHVEVIAELQHLTAVHPLRESLHALLMLALYGADRQGDALAAYRHARGVLIDELGTEPGSRLRELHRQILAADTVLAAPEPAPLAGAPGPAVPCQLPSTDRHFTGPRELDPMPAGDVMSASCSALPASFENARRWSSRARLAGLWPGGKLDTAGTGSRPDRRRPRPTMLAWAGWALAVGVVAAAGVILSDRLGAVPQPPAQIAPPCAVSAPAVTIPTVCMNTADGDQNTAFVVQGSGFASWANVKLTLTVFSQPPPRQIFHGTAPHDPVVGKNGTFRYVIGSPGAFFTQPLPLGLYEVSVTEPGGHQASTAFRVVPGP